VRKPFYKESKSFGETEIVIDAEERKISISFPRISPMANILFSLSMITELSRSGIKKLIYIYTQPSNWRLQRNEISTVMSQRVIIRGQQMANGWYLAAREQMEE
jgi:hypothetical protein